MTSETAVDEEQQHKPPASTSPEPATVLHVDSTTDENAPIVVVEKEPMATGRKSAEPTNKQVVAAGVQVKKTHLEQRLRRQFLWTSMHFSVFCGRVLSKLGVRGAEHRALRKSARWGAGIRRSVLPGVSHAKAVIAGVKCRVYRRVGDSVEGARPVLIYLHGGGWVICSCRSYHAFMLGLCRDTGATIISVDYRLAPENAFPAGLDDCLAVTRAVLKADTSEDLPPELQGGVVDVNRVVLGGDSAGGNYAGCVALDMIRAGDERRLLAIMLICPVLQAITQAFESFHKAGRYAAGWLSWFLVQYAGVEQPKKRLLKLVTQGRHVPEETTQRLIAKYMPTSENQQQQQQPKANDPDSGCQTASSSLPSPQPKPVVDELPAKAASPVPGDATEDKSGGAGLVVPVTANAESHVETDQLIEKAVEIPEALTELATNARAWPLLAEDAELAQLPICMIQVCSEDPLLDEGRIFADRVRNAGAKEVRYFFVPRAQHAEAVLGNLVHSKAAKRGYAELVSFFKDVTGIEDIDQKVETPAPIMAIDADEPPAIVAPLPTGEEQPVTA